MKSFYNTITTLDSLNQ